MSFGDRLGLIGVVVALTGIAITILWPTKMWIGWSCLAVAFALCVAWVGIELRARHGTAEQNPSSVPQNQPIQYTQTLPTPVVYDLRISEAEKVALMKVNTSAMLPFAKDYSLLIIMRVLDNSVDSLTDTRIEKSQPFTITGEIIQVQINTSDDFFRRAKIAREKLFGDKNVGIDVCVIPKRVRSEQILTIADVTALGGRQLTITPTPPVSRSR